MEAQNLINQLKEKYPREVKIKQLEDCMNTEIPQFYHALYKKRLLSKLPKLLHNLLGS